MGFAIYKAKPAKTKTLIYSGFCRFKNWETLVDRRDAGLKDVTINRDLGVISHVLKLAAKLWRDEFGNSWLVEAPLIRSLKDDSRKPYPITQKQQDCLIAELPSHLEAMVLFALNTGCRESEITRLKWCEEDVKQEIFYYPRASY